MRDYFSPLIENAIRLANYWHKGQKRRESEFDYFTHLTAVALILSNANFDDEVVAAGLCHDLLSTTDCPDEEIITVLGQKVFQILEIVKEENQNGDEEIWKIWKEKYIKRIENASEEVKAVCVANRIHNIHILMEILEEKGMNYFDRFVVGPEDFLWFEDNLCMTLSKTWKHSLLSEYDRLIDELVEFLEGLDGEDLSDISIEGEIIKKDSSFENPIVEKTKEKVLKKIEKKEPSSLPAINKTVEKRRKRKSLVRDDATKGIYLSDEEYDLLLPAVLQLCISREKINNNLLQERLKINYLTGYRILKELKRLHVITKADSFELRNVNISRASEILREVNE